MELFLFLGTLFILGAAHALEPGHGKLLVTSYLSGSSASIKDAIFLGLLVAIVHTLSVALLGGSVVLLAFTFFRESLLNSIEVLSGLVILGLGVLLFWRRFIKKSRSESHCDCHLIHSSPAQSEIEGRPQASFKEVFLLGLASGMTPCPMALAAFIAAFALGKAVSALEALTVFSLGIGTVLVILGIILIKGTDSLHEKWQQFRKAPVYIAKISTIILILLGCYLLAKPFLFEESSDGHADESINLLLPSR